MSCWTGRTHTHTHTHTQSNEGCLLKIPSWFYIDFKNPVPPVETGGTANTKHYQVWHSCLAHCTLFDPRSEIRVACSRRQSTHTHTHTQKKNTKKTAVAIGQPAPRDTWRYVCTCAHATPLKATKESPFLTSTQNQQGHFEIKCSALRLHFYLFHLLVQ